MAKRSTTRERPAVPHGEYAAVLSGIVDLLAAARRAAARSLNAVMTATYWEIGRRIVEHEQSGSKRALYGEALLDRLAADLTAKYGRGFSRPNLVRCRQFYIAFPLAQIRSTLSDKSEPGAISGIRSTASNELDLKRPLSVSELARAFPLPWSHYVLLISRSRSPEALDFYRSEALRGGWTVRQLARQIDSQFYERTALSRNKAAVLKKGQVARPEDAVSPDDEIKDPLVLEFLGLKDEYSEGDLEEALIRHLEHFLLELGNDFAFVGRQRRLRIDDEWYRIDLLFFHRRLRCLVIIDLKLGKFTHADAGQMHLYLNYASEHWTQEGENPPVGIILCATKGESLVRYATDNLPNKLLVREYLTVLPDEKLIAAEIDRTRRALERRR
jgi:predicted nuclease of restriction endonuclease-like (RecB) superfamily